MKILVYLDPSIYERLSHLDYVYNGVLLKNQTQKQYQLRFMLAQELIESQKKDSAYQKLDFIPIRKIDYYEIFQEKDREKVHIQVLLNQLHPLEKQKLIQFYKQAFSEWTPDVIIFYEYNNPILREAFPQILCLSSQAGIFARKPFPVSLFFDPIGFLRNNSLKAFEKEIKSFSLNDQQKILIGEFKSHIIKTIDKFNPFKNKFLHLRKKYKNLVLLPLSAAPTLFVKTELNFLDAEQMFHSLMKQIPNNVGVVMTQHPANKIFQHKQIKLLQKKYTNLIYIKEVEFYSISSLFLFQFVDAVINFHSTTGFQALLWNKKIISISNTSNDLIKDGQGISALEQVLRSPETDKSHILYWLLLHYYTYEFDYENSEYVLNFFSRWKKIQQRPFTFAHFQPNSSLENLSKHILPSFRQNVETMVRSSIQKRKHHCRKSHWLGFFLKIKRPTYTRYHIGHFVFKIKNKF